MKTNNTTAVHYATTYATTPASVLDWAERTGARVIGTITSTMDVQPGTTILVTSEADRVEALADAAEYGVEVTVVNVEAEAVEAETIRRFEEAVAADPEFMDAVATWTEADEEATDLDDDRPEEESLDEHEEREEDLRDAQATRAAAWEDASRAVAVLADDRVFRAVASMAESDDEHTVEDLMASEDLYNEEAWHPYVEMLLLGFGLEPEEESEVAV